MVDFNRLYGHANKEQFLEDETAPTLEKLAYALQESFSPDILCDPDGWTPEHASFGHCSATAQIVHDIYGGEIHGFWFGDEAKRWGNNVRGSHFLNVLPDGSRIDFTRSQFPEDFPYDEIMDPGKGIVVDRDEIFDNAGSTGQYYRLKIAVVKCLWREFRIKLNDPNLTWLDLDE